MLTVAFCHSECCELLERELPRPTASLYVIVCPMVQEICGLTLKRVPTPLFCRFVRCSTHGHSFTRLWYIYFLQVEIPVDYMHSSALHPTHMHILHHHDTISHRPGSQGGSVAGMQWACVCGPSETPCGRARPRWSPAAALRGEPEAQSGHLCICQPGWKDGGGMQVKNAMVEVI